MRYPIIIIDFSGIYRYESFSKQIPQIWIDCTDLTGVKYYCQSSSVAIIRRRIAFYSVYGIHFIDSGDYHYMTKIWTDKIKQPFTLIVFDHHSDMLTPAFGKILSCGSWVKDMIENNSYLKNVVVIGVADYLLGQIPSYNKKVVFIKESTLIGNKLQDVYKKIEFTYPIYISIDKDVLQSSASVTNWGNGSLSLYELCSLLKDIISRYTILGVDICGGMKVSNPVFCKDIIARNEKCDMSILASLI